MRICGPVLKNNRAGFITAVVACCLVMGCLSGASPAQTPVEERPVCIPMRAEQPLVIDGQLDDEV